MHIYIVIFLAASLVLWDSCSEQQKNVVVPAEVPITVAEGTPRSLKIEDEMVIIQGVFPKADLSFWQSVIAQGFKKA
jgi:hypothetical protein